MAPLDSRAPEARSIHSSSTVLPSRLVRRIASAGLTMGLKMGLKMGLTIGLAGGLTGGLAAAQSPCADMIGLLDVVGNLNSSTKLLYTGSSGAFFPKDSFYTGKAHTEDSWRCHLLLEKEGAEVQKGRMLVNDFGTVFQRFQVFGGSPGYQLSAPGSYAYSILLDGKPVTKLPFTVTEHKSSDPFNPSTTYTADSELMHWAQIEVIHTSSQPRVGVVFRLRDEDLDVASGEKVFVTVEHKGRVVYSGGSLGKNLFKGNDYWHKFSKSITLPSAQGGGFLPLDDFVKLDGTYRIMLRTSEGTSGKALAGWEYVVQGGGIVPHPRSAFGYEPRTDYLLSRVPAAEGGYSEFYWLEPLADPNAGAEAAAPVAVASASTRSAWKPVSAAPKREPSVVLTDIAARVDVHLAAGDGIVAFGTGANTGVGYLECGDGAEKSIPGGAEFSARSFFCCGKKIVLIKKKQLFVFDTVTGAVEPIPLGEVTLLRSPGDMLKGRCIDADGMLVAVICDPTETADRRTIKVLDLSGAQPQVITLGFPDAEPMQLANIAVDAAGGRVVVGSDRKSCLFTAPIAEDAQFEVIDLSSHDGYPRDCAPIVRGGTAAIFDSTGSRRLRLVDLASGSIRSVGPLGKALQYFDFDGNQIALASDQSYGSSYEIRMTGAESGQAKAPSGAGEKSSFGKVGYGQRVALTGEGLVFASGSGKSGIGKDEVLLVSDGSNWHEVQLGGKALPAVDATLGNHVLAFKTGKSRDARVGYLLLGAGMSGAGITAD